MDDKVNRFHTSFRQYIIEKINQGEINTTIEELNSRACLIFNEDNNEENLMLETWIRDLLSAKMLEELNSIWKHS